jgi:small subunit ribosomal protein S16
MVRIRLRRTGAKNNPAYRIVVADQKSPRDGAFIETLGHYLPTRQPHVVEIDGAKARKWLAQGAQPSDTAMSLLRQKGIVDVNGKVTPEGTEPPVYGTYVAPDKAPAAAAPVAVESTPEVAAEPTPAEPVAEEAVAATETEGQSA